MAEQLATAHARSAALSHLSAAVHHGWKVKTVPDAAWVTIPRNRRLRPAQRVDVIPRTGRPRTDATSARE